MFRRNGSQKADASAIIRNQEELLTRVKAIQDTLESSSISPSSPSRGSSPTKLASSHAAIPHGVVGKGDRESAHGLAAKITLPDTFNIPGGVMLSLNVKTQLPSANNLAAALRKRGIAVWICTELGPGADFRDEIVAAVKKCRVFIPLINDAWGASGECRDEFSLAKRRNLTSHESGRTNPDSDSRLPGILPIAFPDLVWDKYPHVELLAATTNFLVSDDHVIEHEAELLNSVLVSLLEYHVGDDGDKKPIEKHQPQPSAALAHSSVGDSIRSYKANSRPATRFLGTTSYKETDYGCTTVTTDEMEMTLSFGKVNPTGNIAVTAHLVYTNLNIAIVGRENLSLEELFEIYPGMKDIYGVQYGEEVLEGTYTPETGVLDLTSVKVTNAAPTWQHLTCCDDGRILVGVGGNMKGQTKDYSVLDAFRFVAF